MTANKDSLLLRLCGAAVCVAAAGFFVRAAVFLVLPPPAPFQEFSTGRSAAGQFEAAEVDVSYASVLRRNLMNIALEPPPGLRRGAAAGDLTPEEAAALAARLDSLPVSKSGWELLGTIVDTKARSDCRAVISVDGKQTAYPPGREIKNGWRVALIDRRAVVLEKAGRRERLLLGGTRIETPDVSRETSLKTRLDRQGITAQLQDLPGLMKQASIKPSTVDGVAGLNITSIDDRGFFAKIGLQTNDLLVRANGQPLTNFGDLAGFSTMFNQDSLQRGECK